MRKAREAASLLRLTAYAVLLVGMALVVYVLMEAETDNQTAEPAFFAQVGIPVIVGWAVLLGIAYALDVLTELVSRTESTSDTT